MNVCARTQTFQSCRINSQVLLLVYRRSTPLTIPGVCKWAKCAMSAAFSGISWEKTETKELKWLLDTNIIFTEKYKIHRSHPNWVTNMLSDLNVCINEMFGTAAVHPFPAGDLALFWHSPAGLQPVTVKPHQNQSVDLTTGPTPHLCKLRH